MVDGNAWRSSLDSSSGLKDSLGTGLGNRTLGGRVNHNLRKEDQDTDNDGGPEREYPAKQQRDVGELKNELRDCRQRVLPFHPPGLLLENLPENRVKGFRDCGVVNIGNVQIMLSHYLPSFMLL